MHIVIQGETKNVYVYNGVSPNATICSCTFGPFGSNIAKEKKILKKSFQFVSLFLDVEQ